VEAATVAAFNLGGCKGLFSYRTIEWYFPQHGERFDPHRYIDICTWTYVAPSPVSRAAAGPPSPTEILFALTHTVETDVRSETFREVGVRVTTGDGHGGTLTALMAVRVPTADGHGTLVFFWHNRQFIGWDAGQEAMTSWRLVPDGPGAFAVSYQNYAVNDPLCCPSLPEVTIVYRWTGTAFTPNRPVLPGVYGLTNPYAHPVTVRYVG
jgi:hypothetical protein